MYKEKKLSDREIKVNDFVCCWEKFTTRAEAG